MPCSPISPEIGKSGAPVAAVTRSSTRWTTCPGHGSWLGSVYDDGQTIPCEVMQRWVTIAPGPTVEPAHVCPVLRTMLVQLVKKAPLPRLSVHGRQSIDAYALTGSC